jgi:hypothetical protein
LLLFVLSFRNGLGFLAELIDNGLSEHLIGRIYFIASESAGLGLDDVRIDAEMHNGFNGIANDSKLATTIVRSGVERACAAQQTSIW